MRIAIANEWIGQAGGAERVFEAVAQVLPTADLYALTVSPKAALSLGGRPVVTTALDRWKWASSRRAASLPFMPWAWKNIPANHKYDLVITLSHACVKGFGPGRDAVHLCYCHTPMRYVWTPEVDSRSTDSSTPLHQVVGRKVMRRWDLSSVKWVDHFAANSQEVADRIRRFYRRDATVIYPPVDTETFFPDATDHRLVPREDFLLFVGRLIAYKRADIAMETAALLKMPLVVAGSGPDAPRLQRLAGRIGAEIHWVDGPSDELLRSLYSSAHALLFPGYEDLGIVPLEAQACGTPVVAFAAGGALETVRHGVTGLLVQSQTPAAFADAIMGEGLTAITSEACRANALRFSKPAFQEKFKAWVDSSVAPATAGSWA